MKIRLEGTELELEKGVEKLHEIFQVKCVSYAYTNRNSNLKRIYIDVADPTQSDSELQTDWGGDMLRLD